MGFYGSLSVCLSVSCQFVCNSLTLFTHTHLLSLCVSSHMLVFLLHVFSIIFYIVSLSGFFLFAVSFSLFSSEPPSVCSVLLPVSAHAVLHSSSPSFKCWWAVEQYPGGHGDRQPPPCGLFLLLSLIRLLLGSCTLLTAHILV